MVKGWTRGEGGRQRQRQLGPRPYRVPERDVRAEISVHTAQAQLRIPRWQAPGVDVFMPPPKI